MRIAVQIHTSSNLSTTSNMDDLKKWTIAYKRKKCWKLKKLSLKKHITINSSVNCTGIFCGKNITRMGWWSRCIITNHNITINGGWPSTSNGIGIYSNSCSIYLECIYWTITWYSWTILGWIKTNGTVTIFSPNTGCIIISLNLNSSLPIVGLN